MQIVVLGFVFIITKKRQVSPKHCEAGWGEYGGSFFAMDRVVKLDNWEIVLCLI